MSVPLPVRTSLTPKAAPSNFDILMCSRVMALMPVTRPRKPHHLLQVKCHTVVVVPCDR